MALFLAELSSLAKLELLLAQILKHRLLCQEPLILFLVLSLGRNVLDFEIFLDLLRLELFVVRFVHIFLQICCLTTQSVNLGADIGQLCSRLVKSNSKLVQNFISHFQKRSRFVLKVVYNLCFSQKATLCNAH